MPRKHGFACLVDGIILFISPGTFPAVQFIASFCFATQIIRSVRSCRPSRKVYFYFYLKHAIMQAMAIDLVKTFFLFLGKAVKQHVQSGAGPVNSWGGL